jgi:DnaJ-class molecular chaperone
MHVTVQECQECQNIKFERETETITISVESGMRNGQVLDVSLT